MVARGGRGAVTVLLPVTSVAAEGGDGESQVTKADLVEELARVVEMSRKDAEVILEAILDGIARSVVAGDKVEIRGFGSFRTRERQGRIGRNPKTGVRVDVPPKRIPYFKPSKELKDLINHE